MDWMDEANAYRDLIMANIEYDILCERYGEERMDEVVELIFTHSAEITALEASAIPLKDGGQLSFFGSDRPSVIGQLASAKAAEKAAPAPKKTHEPEL